MSKNAFWVVARLPQRLKSTFFEKKNKKKTLILVFEVIVQPPNKHTFEIGIFFVFYLIVLLASLEVVQGSKTRYLFHAAPTNDAL